MRSSKNGRTFSFSERYRTNVFVEAKFCGFEKPQELESPLDIIILYSLSSAVALYFGIVYNHDPRAAPLLILPHLELQSSIESRLIVELGLSATFLREVNLTIVRRC